MVSGLVDTFFPDLNNKEFQLFRKSEISQRNSGEIPEVSGDPVGSWNLGNLRFLRFWTDSGEIWDSSDFPEKLASRDPDILSGSDILSGRMSSFSGSETQILTFLSMLSKNSERSKITFATNPKIMDEVRD